MRRRRFIAAALLGSGLPSAFAARATDDRRVLVRDAAIAFDTTLQLQAMHEDATLARRALAAALDEVRAIDAQISLTRDDSALVRLNRLGSFARADVHVLALLRAARGLSERSGGAFDATVQPLWLAYAHAQALGRLPTRAEIDAARAHVDWRAVAVDGTCVTLTAPATGITLNGIAQGYAADVAIATLQRMGIRDALVDTGEFGAIGHHEAQHGWSVGIAHPRAPNTQIARVELDGRYLAVSGDYETFFSDDFEHHHIFEPRSGRSPTRWSSVAVAARSGVEADGLSTALMVLDDAQGRALLRRTPGADALWIDKRMRVTQTAGLRATLL